MLMRRTTWFTLFFIPVIPYKTEWWLLCPTCQYGITLESEQVEKIRPVAEANHQLSKGEITETEYFARMAALNGTEETKVIEAEPAQALPEPEVVPELEVLPAIPAPAQEVALETASVRSKFCGECGKGLQPEGKFCIHCGTKAIS